MWKAAHAQTVWWRKLSSVWSLSGCGIENLYSRWETEFEKIEALKKIISKTAELWSEIKLSFVSDPPAKDARCTAFVVGVNAKSPL